VLLDARSLTDGSRIDADVCVVGAGIAGISAAIEAARCGRRVALVDAAPTLGGQSVGAIIGTFCGLYGNGPDPRRLTHGIADDWLRDLLASGDAREMRGRRNTIIVQYRIEALARWIEEAVRRAGITVLLGAVLRGVRRAGRRLAVLEILTTSGDVEVEAAGPDGAVAIFTATAVDVVDGSDPVSCAPASGAVFAIGVTTVTCSATDAHGRTASAQLSVTVEDATAPSIRLVAPSADGTLSAVAGDAVGVVGVTFTIDGVFAADVTVQPYKIPWDTAAVANGSHVVTATARDAAGNTASATIKAVKKPK